jgi:hypothetical protein
MRHRLPAVLLFTVAAACSRQHADQPGGAGDASRAPAPRAATAVIAPEPARRPPQDSQAAQRATEREAVATTADAGPMPEDVRPRASPEALAGGQGDAVLADDLRRCGALSGSVQDACRANAEDRYTQRAASGAQEPPVRTP